MDSNNSGSVQSSSGGDDDYESRAAADPISPFITSARLRPIPAPPPLMQFDPLPNYFHLHDLNPVWTQPQRPDIFQPPENNPNSTHTAARNPKKRSRASRRTPTTVLTTDTTNFRAMVQEFTGVPTRDGSRGFSGGPRPPRDFNFFIPGFCQFGPSKDRILDPSLVPTAPFDNTNNSLSFPPPYLRRPFPQKAQSPPSFLLNSTTTQNSNIFNNNNINPINPFLASLLQTKNDHLTIKTDGVDLFEFGHDQHVTAALPKLVSSDHQITPPRNDINDNDNNPDEDEARIRSVNGGYNFTSTNTTSSSTNETRGEGMVESWMCSSELK